MENFLMSPVWPDWAFSENSWSQVFFQTKTKYLVSFWSYLKSSIFNFLGNIWWKLGCFWYSIWSHCSWQPMRSCTLSTLPLCLPISFHLCISHSICLSVSFCMCCSIFLFSFSIIFYPCLVYIFLFVVNFSV